jgi:hypothetical protein
MDNKNDKYGRDIEWENENNNKWEKPSDEHRNSCDHILIDPISISVQQIGWQYECYQYLDSQRPERHLFIFKKIFYLYFKNFFIEKV